MNEKIEKEKEKEEWKEGINKLMKEGDMKEGGREKHSLVIILFS